jgi:hypothetical protein
MTLTALRPRNCVLDEKSHRYYWDPKGENIQMAISVTGVIAAGKPPVDYSKYPEAAPRGTHVHRAMQALAEGKDLPDPVSPEGIDCSEWFRVLQDVPLWGNVDVQACEYVMTRRKWSLGGSLDLLVEKDGKRTLIDVKTKSAKWELPKPRSRFYDDWEKTLQGYKAQAGAYADLLETGDDGGPCWIDSYRTLIVTPNFHKWISFDEYEASHAWADAWQTYLAHKQANPF